MSNQSITDLKEQLSDLNIDTNQLEKAIKKTGNYTKLLRGISEQLYDQFSLQESELESQDKKANKKHNLETKKASNNRVDMSKLQRMMQQPRHSKSKRLDKFHKQKSKIHSLNRTIREKELGTATLPDEIFTLTQQPDKDIEKSLQDSIDNSSTYVSRFKALQSRTKRGQPSVGLSQSHANNPII
jgi:chromosome segregation ATPase